MFTALINMCHPSVGLTGIDLVHTVCMYHVDGKYILKFGTSQ